HPRGSARDGRKGAEADLSEPGVGCAGVGRWRRGVEGHGGAAMRALRSSSSRGTGPLPRGALAPANARVALLAVLTLAIAASQSDAALHVPRPAERTLENGLRVVVLQRTRLPIVQLQLVFPAAAAAEPAYQSLRAISQLSANPRALAEEQVWALVFEGHPYGRIPFGTVESMGHISVDQVRVFYHDHYSPDHAVLAIAGDVTPERAFSLAQEWFGRWEKKPGASTAPPAPRPASTRRIRIVDVPDTEQAEIRLGF